MLTESFLARVSRSAKIERGPQDRLKGDYTTAQRLQPWGDSPRTKTALKGAADPVVKIAQPRIVGEYI